MLNYKCGFYNNYNYYLAFHHLWQRSTSTVVAAASDEKRSVGIRIPAMTSRFDSEPVGVTSDVLSFDVALCVATVVAPE